MNFLGEPVTPERVVEAYSATGLTPVGMVWVTADGLCGCALTALVLASGHRVEKGMGLMEMAEIGGCGVDEASSFVAGFDGEYRGHSSNKEAYDLGRSIGLRVLP